MHTYIHTKIHVYSDGMYKHTRTDNQTCTVSRQLAESAGQHAHVADNRRTHRHTDTYIHAYTYIVSRS